MEEARGKIQEDPGTQRKDMEFYEELSDFFGSDPKIIPCSSVSSMAENPRERDETSSDEDDAARSEATKKKRKRKSKSLASEMIEFLKEFKEDKQKEEKEKLAALNKMHKEKMDVMNRFVGILSKGIQSFRTHGSFVPRRFVPRLGRFVPTFRNPLVDSYPITCHIKFLEFFLVRNFLKQLRCTLARARYM